MTIGVIGYGYWGPNLVRNFAEVDGGQRHRRCRRQVAVAKRYPTDGLPTSKIKLEDSDAWSLLRPVMLLTLNLKN